ncbi:conserved Plasmodium protein, unknown function [Plasmodium gallinaceum]|uniref:mTERF domain-containing protein n=1 Tax=Plasmodium gallinaceum TaxID=5849 RepID=A0A1J1GLP8_PLAGA|nr:conserved Plasmodium protein, unknown function [Plasmodium gallinaceum]CRG93268.1 conserved Plasmodium protein, unknown function [Plasmodium gallinaceum]
MNVFLFFVIVIAYFNLNFCYIRCINVIYSNIIKKYKDIINNDNLVFLYDKKKKVCLINNCYNRRSKNNLFYLKKSPIVQNKEQEKLKKNCFKIFESRKYIENLKNIKKIDNTILGSFFNGNEDKLIDELPEKYLNAFKWALEFRLKNFNCKFMRIKKIAKKNNEELKSLDNYAIGYKENLLVMLQKDKNFFLNIINKLKSKEYFNFDIYSIFRFLNIDIRFLFYPDCHDESAIFFLIFGNLDKVINYYIKNKDQVDFTKIIKDKNITNYNNENKQGEEIINEKEESEQKKNILNVIYNEETENINISENDNMKNSNFNNNISSVNLKISNEKDKNEKDKNEEDKNEEDKNEEDKNEEDKNEEDKNEVDKREEDKNEEDKNEEDKNEEDKNEEGKNEQDKLEYFIKNYDKIYYFLKNHFKTSNELKSFFEKCYEKENKIKKNEINFNLSGEQVINTKEIITDGLNLEMIKNIIKKSPRLSLVNKHTILKRISHYKNDLNYSYKELLKILYDIPQFYAFGNLKKKYKELLYLHESIEEEDLKKLIKKYPRIFTYNIYRTIRPKLLYLIRHLNKKFPDILCFPQYFSYSFRLRIIPRHVAYMSKYYDNYIEYYKELVKKYNYEDFNKNFNDLVYKPNIPPINLRMLLQTSNKAFMKHYNISYYDFVKSTQMAKHIHNPFIIV